MNSIVVAKNGKDTVQAISSEMKQNADQLQLYSKRNGGGNFWRKNGKRARRGWIPNFREYDKIIRWAYAGDINTNCNHSIIYNRAASISLASNKRRSRQRMQDNSVDIPTTYYSIDEARQANKYPMIGRLSHHHAGKNFFVIQNRTELDDSYRCGCTYWSDFYPKTIEYRVHCAHGKVLAVQQKTGDTNQYIWNHSLNGFRFEIVNWENYKMYICKLALDACKALDLDFGAVDILAKPNNRNLPKAVVCEVNTSPLLCEYTSSRYAKYFDWLLNSDNKLPHYDYTTWTVGKSFAFKNEQLNGGGAQPTDTRPLERDTRPVRDVATPPPPPPSPTTCALYDAAMRVYGNPDGFLRSVRHNGLNRTLERLA